MRYCGHVRVFDSSICARSQAKNNAHDVLGVGSELNVGSGQAKRDKLRAAVKAMKENPASVQVQTQGCKDIITFGTDTAAAQVQLQVASLCSAGFHLPKLLALKARFRTGYSSCCDLFVESSSACLPAFSAEWSMRSSDDTASFRSNPSCCGV